MIGTGMSIGLGEMGLGWTILACVAAVVIVLVILAMRSGEVRRGYEQGRQGPSGTPGRALDQNESVDEEDQV